MPTYEYKCNNCEEIFERFQKITDPPLEECPVCGGRLTRLISGGIGIIFKGSGFYVTDSKGAKNSAFTPKEKGADSSDSTESTESAGKGIDTGKSETKVTAKEGKESKKEGPTK